VGLADRTFTREQVSNASPCLAGLACPAIL
jgi:hypothetical protein